MKPRFLTIVLAIAGLLVAIPCDAGVVNAKSVAAKARRHIASVYPSVEVQWVKDHDHAIAQFTYDEKEYEVFFTKSGKLVRTEYVYKQELPEAVRAKVEQHFKYSRIADKRFVVTPDNEEYYRIVLEEHGRKDVQLNIHADGSLVR